MNKLESDCGMNPLSYLAEWSANEEPLRRQIGFMAEYLLDNICKTLEKKKILYLLNSFDLVNAPRYA